MTGGRGRGRGGGGGNRGGNRGRGAPSNLSSRPNGLDALTGGTVARRGTGRGDSNGAGTRGRGGFGAGRGKKEQTPEPFTDDGYTGIPYDPKFAEQRKGKLNTTPYKWHEYPQRFEYLKHAQQFKKQEQIAAGQMDPDGQMDLSKSVDKYGLCTDLCPELERVRRIVQKDVAGPEFTKETARGPRNQRQPDERRMISAHHRSSAGDELTLMSDLRTPKTLLNAMSTMVNRLKEDDFEWLNGWIWDRSRAVRVELSKNYRKREDNEAYLQCYEMCIRFHLLSMHQMARSKALGKDYQRHNDWEQLGATCNQMTQLWDKIKVYIPEDRKTPSPLEASRVAEIHAYNIILGMKERDHREEVRRDPRVRTAQTIVRAAQDTKNPAAFWRLVQSSQVSYLMACAAATRFHAVRVDTLEAMVKGYMVHKQKVDEWTSEKLVDILGFDDVDQVRKFCGAYGGEFETDSEGITRLRPETLTMRQDPPGLPKQFFSQKFVETKRGGRNLAAVLLGYNLQKAQSEGLVEATSENREDSLFISDSSAPPNPFAVAGQAPSTVQPGLFDASKNKINFATPGIGVPPISAPANPFASAAAKLNGNGQLTAPANPTATANSFTAPSTINPVGTFATINAFAKPATPNMLATPSATNAPGTPSTTNAFGFPSTTNAFGLSTTTSALEKPAITGAPPVAAVPSLFPTSAASSTGFTGFSFAAPSNSLAGTAASLTPSTGFIGFTGFPTCSAPPVPSSGSATSTAAPFSTKPFQASVASPIEHEKRQEAEEEQRKTEEAQRRGREEEERKAQAERQRKAEEEQQRKAQEEQAKARAVEQQRRLREEKESERLRIEQETALRAEEQRKRALETLGNNLFVDPQQGLMQQYLQHLVANVIQESKEALREERQAQDDALADEMWQQKRVKLARAAFYKWMQTIEQKRRKAKARLGRERRRKFKEEIEERKSSKAISIASTPAPEVQPITDAPVDRHLSSHPNSLPPGLPNGISKHSRTRKMTNSAEQNGKTATQSNDDFSQSYYEARAQSKAYNETQPIVDRTETSYFKLLAIGIDPNKVLKRNFDFVDEEEARQVEKKRLRRSTSSALEPTSAFRQSAPPPTQPSTRVRQSLPPPTTDEERMARYRAIKESLVKSGHGVSQSFDGTQMFNGSTSRLSAVLPSRQATSDVTFDCSTGTPVPNDRPAYWGRTSRFVPQHLYGQPDAIRAYRMQLTGRSPEDSQASPEISAKKVSDLPNFLSSPIPTQQSYHPSTKTHHSLAAKAALVIEDDADEEDAGEGEAGEWEGYEEEGVDEGEHEEEYYSEEGDEEEYSDEEEEEQLAQKPGATQDDAIELSD